MIIDILQDAVGSTISAMATVFLMLFLTGIMSEMGLFHRVAFIAKPLASVSHLPAISASTFVISVGSKLAANTMTARLKEEGHLTERQAFLSALLNTVPVYFREMFTYQLAYVIPVLGLFVGGTYAIIFSATGIIKLLIIIILGRKFLAGDSMKLEETTNSPPKKTILESLNVVPIAHLFQVPPETIIPLTVFVASPKAGMSILGPMVQNGSLSEVKALIVLMLGSMFMLPFIAIRSEVPNYTSLFGMRMGFSLVAISTAISMIVRLIALCLLLLMT